MAQFKIASWNVNSLRVRLPQLLEWLTLNQPDVIALQETKVEDLMFPLQEIEAAGYHIIFSGQKSYNGIATLSKTPMTEVEVGIPGFDDLQRRVLTMTTRGVRVVNVYVPNGQSLISEKYQYKLNWLQKLTDYLQQDLVQHPQLLILGDFNIAPEDQDVHDPIAWQGSVLVSEAERIALRAMEQVGLRDVFRLFEQPAQSFSWWDYRAAGFRRNLGLRIDHILASNSLSGLCQSCIIDKVPRGWERPSDHAPVIATFNLPDVLISPISS